MKRNKRERESIRVERAHKKRERKCFHKKREISPCWKKKWIGGIIVTADSNRF